jgi:hypothetical protein
MTDDGKPVACAHEHALTEETMRNAIIIRDWFKAHQERLRGPEQAVEEDAMWAKVEKLTKSYPELTARQVCRHHICETMKEAEQLLDRFVSNLWLVSEERSSPKGGHKFKVYRRSPLDRQ